MGEINGVSVNSELLEAQAHVWNHIFKYISSMSLKCAVQLGIPDIIHNHGQSMSLSDLVSALHVHPSKAQSISRLMRLLVHSGFFTQTTPSENELENEYSLTLSSKLLLKSEPFSVIPLLFQLEPLMTKPWDFLSSWFKADQSISTTFELANEKPIFALMGEEPKFKSLFHQAMLADSKFVANLLVNDCMQVFEGLSSLVDVGGGTGTMAKAISEAFPHINCTVFDLPIVVDHLQGTNNLKFVGGNMFQSIPPANAVLLKWILHNWDDEKSLEILRQCRKAIPNKAEGGKLLIIETVIEKQKEDNLFFETQLYLDMLMMVNLNGKQRTEDEWKKLFLAAGFSGYKIVSKFGVRSLVEVYP